MRGEDDTTPRSTRAALLEVLDVRRRARIGFTVGIVSAMAIFVVFVILPEATQSPALYVALGVVLALSLGLLFTGALVIVAIIRFMRDPDSLPIRSEDDEP